MFSHALGREEHHKQISLACVGSARSVWATLGLPPFTLCVLSHSTLLRLQVALQGNRLKGALGCMHFRGLSGSGPQVLHTGTDWVGPAFCALPRAAQATRCLASMLSQLSGGLITSQVPDPWFPGRAISGVPCVSSGELISVCSPPGRCQPSKIPGKLG